MLAVTINSHVFNNDTADSDGTKWWVTDIQGWDGIPIEQSMMKRSGRPGGVVSRSTYQPRPIIVTGLANCTSEANFWLSRQRLSDTLDLLDSTAAMTIVEGTYTKFCTVRLAGQLRMTISPSHFSFNFALVAEDPFKYNNTATSSSAPASVTNHGNAESFPVATVTAGAGGYTTITNTTIPGSPQVRINNLATGDVIDFNARTVVDSVGTSKYNSLDLSSTTWWAVQPGANALTYSGATVSLSFRDAWL